MDKRIHLIDDDKITNTLHRLLINRALPELPVKEYTDPYLGLDAMVDSSKAPDGVSEYFFVDINMPALNGFDLLRQYEEKIEAIPDKIKIFVLSSSIDPEDMRTAQSFSSVKSYLTKPLSAQMIKNIL